MSRTEPLSPPVPGEPCKMISAYIADDGSDLELLRALRQEKGVVNANSLACKGLSILAKADAKPGKLPEPTLVRVVEILVPVADAEDVFDFVCRRAKIDRPGGGMVALSPAPFCTPYHLPEGVPDEKE